MNMTEYKNVVPISDPLGRHHQSPLSPSPSVSSPIDGEAVAEDDEESENKDQDNNNGNDWTTDC